MSKTFDWIEIKTWDMERTAHFYERVFGWRITKKEMADGFDVWLFDTGGEPRVENLRRGGIWLRPKEETPGVIVYIYVEDIEAIMKRVIELGGKVVGQKTPQGSGYRAYFADPSGNVLGLWEEQSQD